MQDFQINPQGMLQICEVILNREEQPVIDPRGKKAPYWMIVLPKGRLPSHNDVIKVTVEEWTTIMKCPWPFRPKLKAIVK